MIDEVDQSFPLQQTNLTFPNRQKHQMIETDKPVDSDKQAFTIHFCGDKENQHEQQSKSATSLQDAFKQFRKIRQKEIRANLLLKEKTLLAKKDLKSMQELRMKFLDQAKKYFGVPYAKKYHPPGSEMHSAPLFLDCCGLTRRVLRDLKEEFGFNIGPWNQAYQYDTLPNTITKEEMLPGDLVFITGTYFNKKSKAQKHDMVHVEIWLGEGEQTIGARWQKGVVQVFDSYKFVSKSYYNMQYHFKSIDMWLQGICKSYCSEHAWTLTKYTPGVKSIFSIADEQPDQGASDCEDEGDHNHQEQIQDFKPNRKDVDNKLVQHQNADSTPVQCQNADSTGADNTLVQHQGEDSTPVNHQCADKTPPVNHQCTDKCNTIDCYEYSELISIQNTSLNAQQHRKQHCHSKQVRGEIDGIDAPADGDTEKKCDGSLDDKETNSTDGKLNTKKSSGDNGKAGNRGQQTDKSRSNSLDVQSSSEKVRGHGPYFYIGGGNGVALVEEPLLARGWCRIYDKHSDNYRLRWVELKSQINYASFKQGDQMVNRIPNGYLLTTKTGLFGSLREYDRVLDRISKPKSPRSIRMNDFFPESFVLDIKSDRDAFFQTFKDGETWICKPNGMNQGKGIYLVRDLTDLKAKYGVDETDPQVEKASKRNLRPYANQRLIQRYIANPLLLDGKKFDVRSYMLIASTTPFIVFFHPGYCRLSCDNYDPDSHDLARHLTNQYQQKKNPSYQDIKEDTVWSMDRFNEYVNGLASEKGLSKDWVLNSFTVSLLLIESLHRLYASFNFFQVYVLEINCNPALHTNCEVLKQVLPPMIEETLDIAIEVFGKNSKNKAVNPIQSVRRFIQLYNADNSRHATATSRPKSLSPTRARPTPISPLKKKSLQTNKSTQPTKTKERAKSTTPLRV
ncbi:uncharacterized protein LOC117114242 [Anneissia japonica]|uniref:uncharacterized protein LOC117114242 n=1 Tax=Anneissia japonica TaxID=1529436 RepID=UPI0014259388|nr:uncharacterized protein LOC117114242 [Anneissia japonica]